MASPTLRLIISIMRREVRNWRNGWDLDCFTWLTSIAFLLTTWWLWSYSSSFFHFFSLFVLIGLQYGPPIVVFCSLWAYYLCRPNSSYYCLKKKNFKINKNIFHFLRRKPKKYTETFIITFSKEKTQEHRDIYHNFLLTIL